MPAAGGQAAVPAFVPPMLATLGELPPDDGRWAFEPKWDGVRTIACVGADAARLWSRNENEVTAAYPELTVLPGLLGGTPAILDGEVVAFDAKGRPSFGVLQRRMHLRRPSDVAIARREVAAYYVVFDLLALGGQATVTLPYVQRRELLDALELADRERAVLVPEPVSEGRALYEATRDQELEGVLAKRLDAPYLPGRRVDTWRKVKHLHTTDVLVAGWLPGEGRREGTIGAVVMALPDPSAPGGLRHVGQVGTGFADHDLTSLQALLAADAVPDSPLATQLERPAARQAHWVRPWRVAEVSYSEWARDGRLRFPVWRGLRDDVAAADVAPYPGSA